MEPKELVRRYYDEVWVKGTVDAIDEFVASDYTDHTPEGDQNQLERLKRVAAVYRDSATEVALDLDIVVAEGDRVAAFWTMRWTQRGDFFGVPADGKRLQLRGGQFFVLRDGRIAETWHADDYVSLFGQIGLTLKP